MAKQQRQNERARDVRSGNAPSERHYQGWLHMLWQDQTVAIWIRALVYLSIIGGGWLVVLPLALLTVEQGHIAVPLRPLPYLLAGAVVFATAVLLALVGGYYLITRGRGTPLPLDPTRELVMTGPYHYVRNPQSIAMTLAVVGEVVAVESRWLWLLLPLKLLYLEVLVGPWEDRQLVEKHGARYLAYKRSVPRWLPRLRDHALPPDRT
jgi:protein-S-isoprenylcysteine O-methyltransferase Ste14